VHDGYTIEIAILVAMPRYLEGEDTPGFCTTSSF